MERVDVGDYADNDVAGTPLGSKVNPEGVQHVIPGYNPGFPG